MQNRAVIWKTSLRFCCLSVLSSVTDGKICDRCVWVRVKERASACLFFPKLSHLRCCFSPVVSLHSLQYTSLPVLSLCVSLSLPVSCALFQGWGLRHAFHLAYEALILFRAGERERKTGGERERDVGGGWVEWGRHLSPPCCLKFVLLFHCWAEKHGWVAVPFVYYLFICLALVQHKHAHTPQILHPSLRLFSWINMLMLSGGTKCARLCVHTHAHMHARTLCSKGMC